MTTSQVLMLTAASLGMVLSVLGLYVLDAASERRRRKHVETKLAEKTDELAAYERRDNALQNVSEIRHATVQEMVRTAVDEELRRLGRGVR
ncbi:MAG TPA: hypothetical protein VN238_05960 [Solirubrobacteraceae bacterium]|nr:hypothetical protein [Solirubrobacteraceae bacterium]